MPPLECCEGACLSHDLGKIQRALPASQLFSAMPPLESCEGACLSHDVGEFVKQRETIEVETLRHQQSTFPRNSSEIILHQTSHRGPSEEWRRQCWQIDQEHVLIKNMYRVLRYTVLLHKIVLILLLLRQIVRFLSIYPAIHDIFF